MLLQTYRQEEHFGSKSMRLTQGDGQEIEKNRQKCAQPDGPLKDKIPGDLHLPMGPPQLSNMSSSMNYLIDQVSIIIRLCDNLSITEHTSLATWLLMQKFS